MIEKFSLQRSMTDKNVSLLLEELYSVKGNYLIIADENWAQTNWTDLASRCQCELHIISNRYDVAQQAEAAGLSVTFNDLDFSHLENHYYDGILFRVCKERASSHHVINHAFHLLKPQGSLLLSGNKNDGIKAYVKNACNLFGDRTAAKKNGNNYLAIVTLYPAEKEPLDDKSYAKTRNIAIIENVSLRSKPGIFGWEKVDRGSAFLVEHLPLFLERFPQPPKSLLDLGCGYGYLCSHATEFGIEQITATDNNAAALLATTENFQTTSSEVQVIASDAGDTISQRFDTIWCNPPFHQGFAVDGDMSSKFLAASRRLLAPGGHALFVVNTFIPLEQKAKKYFRSIQVLEKNSSFKLIALSN